MCYNHYRLSPDDMSEESAVALNYLKFQNVQNLTVSKLRSLSLVLFLMLVTCTKKELCFRDLTHEAYNNRDVYLLICRYRS